MDVISTFFPEVKILVPAKFGDQRGFFSETYSRRTLAKAEIFLDFVQDNYSCSTEAGTVRGLHFQSQPFAQDKLVQVVRGAILDVVVDIRHGSPTFGKHVSIRLSAKDWQQLFVPVGFAHGLCTLEPHTDVMYKVSNYYSAAHDRGLRWNDPALGIDWPVPAEEAIVSARDEALPPLAALPRYFSYQDAAGYRKAASA